MLPAPRDSDFIGLACVMSMESSAFPDDVFPRLRTTLLVDRDNQRGKTFSSNATVIHSNLIFSTDSNGTQKNIFKT